MPGRALVAAFAVALLASCASPRPQRRDAARAPDAREADADLSWPLQDAAADLNRTADAPPSDAARAVDASVPDAAADERDDAGPDHPLSVDAAPRADAGRAGDA